MPEPVRISVSEVRREIYRASGFASGNGQPSTQMLGSLFHRVFQTLMQPESDRGWTNVLDAETLGDSGKLQEHAYESIVGPYLRQNQAALQSSAREVLSLWEATGHLCGFICRLLMASLKEGALRPDPKTHQWRGADQFSIEEELTWLAQDDSWTGPVLVSGVVDAVWRNPSSKRWCALELKLGAGSTEADLAQLCLYHEMLRSNDTGGGRANLFVPLSTRVKLLAMVGRTD